MKANKRTCQIVTKSRRAAGKRRGQPRSWGELARARCMTARDRLRAWDVKFFGSSNLTHKSCGIFVASWGFALCIGTRLVFHIFFYLTVRRTNGAGLRSTHFFGLTRLWLIWQSRWLNSDSTQIPNWLTWLNSDSTQNPNLLTWLNSNSTHLSQSWVKFDSRLIQFYLIWENVVDRGGGGLRSNVAVG